MILLMSSNIPMKDPSHIPDPYVTIYLLPGRAKDTKRKTAVIKDACDPVYETTFEYELPLAELNKREVEVVVKTKALFLSSRSCAIGWVKFFKFKKKRSNYSHSFLQTKIPLKDKDIIDKEHTNFYELLKEIKLGTN